MTKTRKTALRELGISRQIEPREIKRTQHELTPDMEADFMDMYAKGLTATEITRMLFRRYGWGGHVTTIRSRIRRMLDTPSDSPLT